MPTKHLLAPTFFQGQAEARVPKELLQPSTRPEVIPSTWRHRCSHVVVTSSLSQELDVSQSFKFCKTILSFLELFQFCLLQRQSWLFLKPISVFQFSMLRYLCYFDYSCWYETCSSASLSNVPIWRSLLKSSSTHAKSVDWPLPSRTSDNKVELLVILLLLQLSQLVKIE